MRMRIRCGMRVASLRRDNLDVMERSLSNSCLCLSTYVGCCCLISPPLDQSRNSAVGAAAAAPPTEAGWIDVRRAGEE